jgi:arsenite-transporting ATPase
MARILTFLGKGGTGRTTIAIAAAKQFATQGKRVLLVSQDPSPAFGLFLGASVTADPHDIEPNLKAVQLQAAVLLERAWEELKKQEAKYLRTPFFKAVYGQELGVLPGMDTALALNAIREFDENGQYDVIVYDGNGDQVTLRMLGMPEVASWYARRFQQVFMDSDLAKAVSPFLQPLSAAVLNNVNWSGDIFSQPAATQATSILEQGKAALADPDRVSAYLVTTNDTSALVTAKYLWGSAQQVGLTVGGVLLNQADITDSIQAEFAPLPVTFLPQSHGDWQTLMQSLPDLTQAGQAPKPVRVDVAERKVYLFLPGFDKKQVKLTQYGPEVTVEAGDQRRNVFLPPELKGKQVTGAKFQDGYLIISF